MISCKKNKRPKVLPKCAFNSRDLILCNNIISIEIMERFRAYFFAVVAHPALAPILLNVVTGTRRAVDS